MKYSIVMPYIDRLKELEVTLNSYKLWYGNRDDWELIIVPDAKADRTDTIEAVALAKDALGARRVVPGAYPYPNPHPNSVVLFNYGYLLSAGNFIVTTNPECYHETDVLGAFDRYTQEDDSRYLVTACKFETGEGTWIWRQHGELCPTYLHFCSCVHRRNLIKFDEDFQHGYCFDDDALRDAYLLAGTPVLSLDDAVVVHQKHKKQKGNQGLWLKNKEIWAYKYARRVGLDDGKYSRECRLPAEMSKRINENCHQYIKGEVK